MEEHFLQKGLIVKMSQTELLLFHAAQILLFDGCPPNRRYYYCRTHPDESEEPGCLTCWSKYLLDVVNHEIHEDTEVLDD